MPNTPRSDFQEADLTFTAPSPAVGITLFIGECKRGPIANPSNIFTTWEAFRKVHGGLVAGNNFPLEMQRALKRGSAIRVCNVKHYSDISAGTLAGTKSVVANSSLVALSTALVAGVTFNVTVNGNLKTQLFSVSHENTLALICAQLKTLAGIVEDAFSLLNNTLIIIPKAGVALTVTSTATGSGAPTLTITTEGTIEDSSNNTLFSLTPKYIGSDYDNLVVKILPATNGDITAFNLQFIHLVEPDLTEKYENLKILGLPTVPQSNYLKKVTDNSVFFDVVYNDLSGISASQITPRLFALRYQSGSDGGSAVDTDYIGSSSSKTGLNSADSYADTMQICIPDKSSVAILQAGASYAAARADIQFFGWLGNFTTEAALATARDNTSIDSKYTQLYAQSITVLNPLDNSNVDISPLGDIAGCADYSDGNFGPWWSFAGTKRGQLFDVLQVTNNFGTPGNTTNLNMIGNRQVNIIVNDGNIHILGNFTAQKAESEYSFGNVTRFIIYLKKTMGPLLKTFIEDPNDIPTWKLIYLAVKPILNNFGTKRALYGEENVGWMWQGDQFAKDLTDLKVNNATDVGVGKYKVRLFVKPVPALQFFSIDIVLSPSGVSFEDLVSAIQN